ncbi:MAG: 50S ribosomal protein L10 [Nitrospiraceae bacterium]|nr:MAG: 50S ribosomal protein L10 [Nitrospiraceae bacterium]
MNKLNKEEKTRIISELQDKFGKAKGVVFTDFRGLNVEEITTLRNSLRSAAIEYKVVKNTLAKRASAGTPVEGVKDVFAGPVGIAVGYDDPALLVKKVLEYSKSNEKLQIKGGVVEGSICSPDQIRSISELPPREVLLSMLAGAMQSPLGKLAGLLHSTVTQFAYALGALKNKKESGQ